jgi:hypothetical protein
MPDTPQTALTLKSILTLALSAGVFTAVFNQSFAWIKETVQRLQNDKRAGGAFALQLVEMLTAYAQQCTSRIYVNDPHYVVGNGGPYAEMPVLPHYPEGPWEVLPPKLAAGIRDLRNEVDQANSQIKGAFEVDGPSEGFETATNQFAVVGYSALRFANRLRRHYGLGPYQAAGNSDFAATLRRRYQQSQVGPLRWLLSKWPNKRRLQRRWQRFLRKLVGPKISLRQKDE